MDQLEQLPMCTNSKTEKVQATWTVGSQKRLFALLLLFVKVIPELLRSKRLSRRSSPESDKGGVCDHCEGLLDLYYLTHLFMLVEIFH